MKFLFWSLLVCVGIGCAPAYHSYPSCKVDCSYCAPPPLPFTHYEGCVCHSCAASAYLSLEQPAENIAPEELGAQGTAD